MQTHRTNKKQMIKNRSQGITKHFFDVTKILGVLCLLTIAIYFLKNKKICNDNCGRKSYGMCTYSRLVCTRFVYHFVKSTDFRYITDVNFQEVGTSRSICIGHVHSKLVIADIFIIENFSVFQLYFGYKTAICNVRLYA